jgi:hypothetical protein
MSTNGQQSNAADGRGEAWLAPENFDGAKAHLGKLAHVIRFATYHDRAKALGCVPQTLSDIADARQWVAWLMERGDEGEPRKVPKNPATGCNAQVPTNPGTYGTRKAAEKRWRRTKENSASAEGGIGVVLGKLEDGDYLVGIDLDTSCDAGTIADGAQEVIDRFNTYTEISPSGKGVKLFFLMDAADMADLRNLLGHDSQGKQLTRKTFEPGGHREMAIDTARFYAVTDQILENSSEELRHVPFAAVEWFIKVAGPSHLFRNQQQQQQQERDESGSGYGFRFMRGCHAEGMNFEEARGAIMADDGPAGEWARRVDERQIKRAWERSDPNQGGTPDDDADKVDPLAGFRFIGQGSIEPEPMLIDGLVSLTNLTVIAGQSSAGKTFIVILMLLCLAKQKPFFGRAVTERVGSLYVAGEGQGSIEARFAAGKVGLGLDVEEQPPIAWIGEPPSLDNPKKVDAFASKLRALDAKFRQEHGVRLGVVVIDTVSACFDLKDENDNAEVTRICKLMKRLGAGFGGVVVPVHHFGKSIESGVRGASAWRGNSEIILAVLADIDPLTGEAKNRELAAAKVRDGVQGPVASFTLQPRVIGTAANGAELINYFVQVGSEGESRFSNRGKRGRPSRSMTALRDAANEALEINGESKVIQGNPVRAVALKQVRAEFNRRYVVSDDDEQKLARAKWMAFKRALDNLPPEFAVGEISGTEWLWKR